MDTKFVSESFARKWYDLGTKYQVCDNIRSAINAAINDGYEIDCWEKAAAFKAGKRCFVFEVKEWPRFGPVPVGVDGYAERSINHADNECEDGVSVIDDKWLKSIRGQMSKARTNREIVRFTGIQVGFGSDGEPVILPIKAAI